MEIRQNTNAAQSAVYQSISDQSIDIMAMVIGDDELRNALDIVNSGGGTEEEKRLVHAMYRMAIRVSQNRYLQVELGVVDRDRMLFLGGQGRLYRSEGFRAYWDTVKDMFDPCFREYIEQGAMASLTERGHHKRQT